LWKFEVRIAVNRASRRVCTGFFKLGAKMAHFFSFLLRRAMILPSTIANPRFNLSPGQSQKKMKLRRVSPVTPWTFAICAAGFQTDHALRNARPTHRGPFAFPPLLRNGRRIGLSTTLLRMESESTAGKIDSELGRIIQGWEDVTSGAGFQIRSSAWSTWEDVIGIGAMLPLSGECLRTAFTGEISTDSLVSCTAATLLAGVAHAKMASSVPRDFRAPRLAEYRTVYEFSAFYLPPFAWLLLRLTPAYPEQLAVVDPVFCLALSVVTIYGFSYAAYGKKLLREANREGYNGVLEPSCIEYQAQAQLYLTGNVVINALACLFLPFAWTIAFRGTVWWERVQELHPNQAALLGVSVLVAILGDVSGNLLLRLKELGLIKSQPAIVVMGILSNVLLLLFPEIVFHIFFHEGVSEIGFYWD
jgi:hypothetical protein